MNSSVPQFFIGKCRIIVPASKKRRKNVKGPEREKRNEQADWLSLRTSTQCFPVYFITQFLNSILLKWLLLTLFYK